MRNQMDKLPIIGIVQSAYQKFYGSLKHHIVLSYLFMLPLYLIQNIWGLRLEDLINPQTKEVLIGKEGALITILVLSIAVSQLVSILYYRLYTCGKEHYLRLSPGRLGHIYGKSFLYTLTVFALLFLALICLSTLGGLILSILTNTVGFFSSSAANFSAVIAIITAVLFALFLRATPTFISIARDATFISLKDAWYYTRGKTVSFFVLTLLAILPLYILNYAMTRMVGNFFPGDSTVTVQIFLYLISPIALAPAAIFYAACAQVYETFDFQSVDVRA